ncbi:MAG: hypothetical protein HGGPFJEG_02065 [Ignavibacteria bacterium]|nr:hypothetical protein [Ignavibacteria bacterium]
MITKKKRDVKFMIYLGLYLFIIAFITSQGATLMDIGAELPPEIMDDTLISKSTLDSLSKLSTYDEKSKIVLDKPKNNSDRYELLSPDEEKVKSSEYDQLKKENSRLGAQIDKKEKSKEKSEKQSSTEIENEKKIPKSNSK